MLSTTAIKIGQTVFIVRGSRTLEHTSINVRTVIMTLLYYLSRLFVAVAAGLLAGLLPALPYL